MPQILLGIELEYLQDTQRYNIAQQMNPQILDIIGVTTLRQERRQLPPLDFSILSFLYCSKIG